MTGHEQQRQWEILIRDLEHDESLREAEALVLERESEFSLDPALRFGWLTDMGEDA